MSFPSGEPIQADYFYKYVTRQSANTDIVVSIKGKSYNCHWAPSTINHNFIIIFTTLDEFIEYFDNKDGVAIDINFLCWEQLRKSDSPEQEPRIKFIQSKKFSLKIKFEAGCDDFGDEFKIKISSKDAHIISSIKTLFEKFYD
jgi:hypothetical protein